MSLLNTQRPTIDKRRRLQPCQLSELTVINADGSGRRVIFETCELIEAPNWTPDGQWLVFNADGRLYRISPDGKDGPIRINTAPIEDLNNDHVLSPDGATMYLSSRDRHLYAVALSGGIPKRVSRIRRPGANTSTISTASRPTGESSPMSDTRRTRRARWSRASARCRRPAATYVS